MPRETFGAYLASGLADLAQAPVFLNSVAVVGAMTSELMTQIPEALASQPDVCAVIIGANDVTHKVLPSASIRNLTKAVETMRQSGTQVVVGTCPDLGTIRPIAPPLRQVARRWSRRLAAAQAIAVVEAGGLAVSLGTILGPEFEAAPAEMFGPDRFHPSPAGYRSCAAAMLPTVAVGHRDSRPTHRALRARPWRGRVLPREGCRVRRRQHRLGGLRLRSPSSAAAAAAGPCCGIVAVPRCRPRDRSKPISNESDTHEDAAR